MVWGKMYSKEDDYLLQNAMIFAALNMQNCHNKKPVLLHSWRVAFYLYTKQYDISVVITAVLHDLLEDTSLKKQDIESVFGTEIADLVELLTMNSKIEDYKERYSENFLCMQNNIKALTVRCADIMDNAPYVKLATAELQQKIREKQICFYNIAKDKLHDELIWKDFENILITASQY